MTDTTTNGTRWTVGQIAQAAFIGLAVFGIALSTLLYLRNKKKNHQSHEQSETFHRNIMQDWEATQAQNAVESPYNNNSTAQPGSGPGGDSKNMMPPTVADNGEERRGVSWRTSVDEITLVDRKDDDDSFCRSSVDLEAGRARADTQPMMERTVVRTGWFGVRRMSSGNRST